MWQAWVSEFHFSELPANGANEIGPSAARMAYHLLENMLDDLDKRHPGVRDEVRQAFGSPRVPESGTITQGVPVPDPVETEVSTAEVPAAPNTEMACQQMAVGLRQIQSLSFTLMVGVMWVQLPALRW